MKVTRPGFPATGTIQDKEARRSIDALNKAFIDLASALSEDRVVEQADVSLDEGEGIEIELLGKNRFRITCTVKSTESVGGGRRTAVPNGENDGDLLFWKDGEWQVASISGLAQNDMLGWNAVTKTWQKVTPQEVTLQEHYGWDGSNKRFKSQKRLVRVPYAGSIQTATYDGAVDHASLHT